MSGPVPAVRQGTIGRAWVTPPRGPRKFRPVVVYTPDPLIDTSSTIDVVGISTSYYPQDPDCIPLPWRADGNIHTGLRSDCAACLNLLASIDKADFQQEGFLRRNDAAFTAPPRMRMPSP